jgi:hypothetical protein
MRAEAGEIERRRLAEVNKKLRVPIGSMPVLKRSEEDWFQSRTAESIYAGYVPPLLP